VDRCRHAQTACGQPGRLGVAVRPLDATEQRKAHVEGGLMVEDVSGPAARAGIRAGDVILSVNGNSVTSVDELRALVTKAGKQIAILVKRDKSQMFVPVDLG
jgi:serine protease Do